MMALRTKKFETKGTAKAERKKKKKKKRKRWGVGKKHEQQEKNRGEPGKCWERSGMGKLGNFPPEGFSFLAVTSRISYVKT